MQKVYVRQDGADFYVFLRKDAEEPIKVIRGPYKTADWNATAAAVNRAWFEENFCADYDLRPVYDWEAA